MPALGSDAELALPAIIRQRLHGNFFPVGLGRGAMAQNGVQNIVAVGEDVSA